MMKDETTSRLEEILNNVDSEEKAKKFAEEHGIERRFFEYINDYIATHKKIAGSIIEKCGISKNYIYNILNGKTKNPGRDKILAICIASGMTIDEVNRGLKIAGHNPLYPKNERDIHISSCINKGIDDVTQINLMLSDRGIEILDV